MDPTANGLQTGSDQVLNLLYGPYKLIASSKLIGLVPSLSVLVPIGISPPRVLVPIDISPPRVLVPIDISPPRVLVPLDIPPPRSFYLYLASDPLIQRDDVISILINIA